MCVSPLQKEDHIILWNSGSYRNSLKAKKERKTKEGREGEKRKRKRKTCYSQ